MFTGTRIELGLEWFQWKHRGLIEVYGARGE